MVKLEEETTVPRLGNPLLHGIIKAAQRVMTLKDDARQYYYTVLLSVHPCPVCGGPLAMSGPGQCRCECGAEFDSTIEFQRSPCCNAPLKRKVLHYICAVCGRITPSWFLFDERIFDSEYFREHMRQSRQLEQERREAVRRLLAGSRSNPLDLADTLNLAQVPGFEMELDAFIGAIPTISREDFLGLDVFNMDHYRQAILESLPERCSIHFNGLAALGPDRRRDRARKFITLVFMEQAREVGLTQLENDLLVERCDEADREG